MSEERAEYLGEVPQDNTYQIRDEAPHDYFSQIPNIVDELNLTPHAYRLYGHLRRVAGEAGKCWQSTKTLAKSCNMSMGKVSEAKRELEDTYPPLIRVISKTKENGIYHEITITDIWGMNHEYFTGVSVHIVKTPPKRSQCENPRSQCETKKNPVKEEPKEVLTSKDLEQVNAKVDAMISNSGRADWHGRETFRTDHYPLVDWYHKVTGQDCPKRKQKDWHTAVMNWAANGLTVGDLQAAYDMDIKWKGVFTSPNQLTDKAIALRAQGKVKTDEQRPAYAPLPERVRTPRPANVPPPNIPKRSMNDTTDRE